MDSLCSESAVVLSRPVGQWLSNLRRAGALGSRPEWEAALLAVDKDWKPLWSAERQRHYAALRELVADGEGRADVLPGFTVHGMDNGKWPARQRRPEVWQALAGGQRECLERVGITPLAAPAPVEQAVPAEPFTAPMSAFERGVAARWCSTGPARALWSFPGFIRQVRCRATRCRLAWNPPREW